MLENKKCIPCQGGIPPLDKQQIESLIKHIDSDWDVNNEIELVKEYKETEGRDTSDTIITVDAKNIEKTPEGRAMDFLQLNRYCCRRIILGNVHLISYI